MSGLQAKSRALACSYCANIRRGNIKYAKSNINISTAHFSVLNCNRDLEYILLNDTRFRSHNFIFGKNQKFDCS